METRKNPTGSDLKEQLMLQLHELQHQQQMLSTNPQHFLNSSLLPLLSFSPLYSPDMDESSTDVFKLVAETTDQLFRSQTKKYVEIFKKETDPKKKAEMLQHLQTVEKNRREVLSICVQRASITNSSSNLTTKSKEIKNEPTKENSPNLPTHSQIAAKVSKPKLKRSVSWSDHSGKPLVLHKSFDSSLIIQK